MADPVSMGAMVAMQAIGSIQQGASQSSAYKAEATADDANALQSLAFGSQQEASIRGRLRATQGDAIVAEGAGGTAIGTGSALDMLRQNAINASFDVLGARAQAASRANAYYTDAASKRKAASNAMLAGIIGAGSAALKGYAGIKQMNGPGMMSGPQLAIPLHLQSLVTPKMTSFDPMSVPNNFAGDL